MDSETNEGPAVAATASLSDATLVPQRKKINAEIRGKTFEWLDRNSYAYIPSEANCFLLDAKRPGKEMIDAMSRENVTIGRVWPVMPNWVRITVGTQPRDGTISSRVPENHERRNGWKVPWLERYSAATAFPKLKARSARSSHSRKKVVFQTSVPGSSTGSKT